MYLGSATLPISGGKALPRAVVTSQCTRETWFVGFPCNEIQTVYVNIQSILGE